MAIDDPLDASEQRVAAEERSNSALARLVPYLAELGRLIPASVVPYALKAAGLWVSKLEAGRREYLMTTLRDELRRVRADVESLDESHRRFIEEEFIPLVLDGLQKAEQTRSQERIRRIAAVLAHAYEAGPSRSADLAEEIMRVAMLLSDDEVLVLRGIYEGQIGDFNPHLGWTGHEQANDFWRLLDPTQRSYGDPPIPLLNPFRIGHLQGICAKLQSLGLVAQVERNNFKLSPGFNPYALLAKGVDFVEYIRNSR